MSIKFCRKIGQWSCKLFFKYLLIYKQPKPYRDASAIIQVPPKNVAKKSS